MQLQILTSNSNNYRYIDRFDDITRIALALKAQLYYADPITNKIYGFYEEHYSIIEIDVPFRITNPVFFAGYGIPKDHINANKTYFYVEEYPFFLFPENRRGDFMNHNIGYKTPDTEFNDYCFVDNMTKHIIEDSFISYDPEKIFRVPEYMRILEGYKNRAMMIRESFVFDNMQDNEVIAKVIGSKVSLGVQLLVLSCNGRQFGFYVFKSLLGPITKADSLSIIIYPDPIESTKFMVTFRVTKKKSKIEVPELKNNCVVIDTHAVFLNLF